LSREKPLTRTDTRTNVAAISQRDISIAPEERGVKNQHSRTRSKKGRACFGASDQAGASAGFAFGICGGGVAGWVAVLRRIAISFDMKEANQDDVANEEGLELAPANAFDPVIEEYKKGVDMSLVWENLKLSPHERAVRMQNAVAAMKKWRGMAQKTPKAG
jgi:hypothetical protein